MNLSWHYFIMFNGIFWKKKIFITYLATLVQSICEIFYLIFWNLFLFKQRKIDNFFFQTISIYLLQYFKKKLQKIQHFYESQKFVYKHILVELCSCFWLYVDNTMVTHELSLLSYHFVQRTSFINITMALQFRQRRCAGNGLTCVYESNEIQNGFTCICDHFPSVVVLQYITCIWYIIYLSLWNIIHFERSRFTVNNDFGGKWFFFEIRYDIIISSFRIISRQTQIARACITKYIFFVLPDDSFLKNYKYISILVWNLRYIGNIKQLMYNFCRINRWSFLLLLNIKLFNKKI